MNSAVIAITGSPQSGKTTFAFSVAKDLSEYSDNILVLFADDLTPTLSYLQDEKESKHDGERSIGNILLHSLLSDEIIFDNLVISDENKKILMLGYKHGDNIKKYAKFSINQVQELLFHLKSMFDFIVIDCSSHTFSSVISLAAIKIADVILNIQDKSAKSFSYQASNKHFLFTQKEDSSKVYDIVNATLEEQNDLDYNVFTSQKDYELPYLEELHEQLIQGNLMCDLKGKKNKKYRLMVEEIVKNTIIEA